jgi:hypothetical protein
MSSEMVTDQIIIIIIIIVALQPFVGLWPLFQFLDPIPALPDFLRSSGSGTGSTQPREDN